MYTTGSGNGSLEEPRYEAARNPVAGSRAAHEIGPTLPLSGALRHTADRLELGLEQGLVDLPQLDGYTLLDADLDHFLPFDAKLLGQLFWREVIRHDPPSLCREP
jgi:hypothetical protein